MGGVGLGGGWCGSRAGGKNPLPRVPPPPPYMRTDVWWVPIPLWIDGRVEVERVCKRVGWGGEEGGVARGETRRNAPRVQHLQRTRHLTTTTAGTHTHTRRRTSDAKCVSVSVAVWRNISGALRPLPLLSLSPRVCKPIPISSGLLMSSTSMHGVGIK